MIYYTVSFFSFLLMATALFFVLFVSPTAQGLGEFTRIIYYHVPTAWIAVLSFVLSGISAIWVLIKEDNRTIAIMESSAELGTLFIIIATITGSVWAKSVWGSFWNWDPRETSVAMILMIYLAYFVFKSRGAREVARAAYLTFSAAMMPFFIFVLPRLYPSLHPDTILNSEKKVHLHGSMLAALLLSIAAYTLYFLLFFIISYKTKMKQLESK